MIVIGLTGSIGMGKTTTARLFAGEGVPVFDSDATVHKLYAGPAVGAIETAFPGTTRAGAVARDLLAQQVVGDEVALRRLEAIVHPLVRAERETFLARAAAKGASAVVLDVPLLFETGGDGEVDAVVLASAPEAVQKARVMARPGMTEARFAAILARQMPDAEKRRRAHFVVETGAGLDAAHRDVKRVLATLQAEQQRA